jgi:NADPH:quinone reductase-like Zn-dependent oxidoreductase
MQATSIHMPVSHRFGLNFFFSRKTFAKMRTVVLDTASDALVAKETPDLPEPGVDEVLLRVLACGVSPLEMKTAKLYGSGPQLAAGFEVVGEVERVGSHVTDLLAGDQVRSVFVQEGEGER